MCLEITKNYTFVSINFLKMKIIIFGLGNFGMSLALSLPKTGNEVIGKKRNQRNNWSA